jgi:tRNA pseudouridine55 synthase
MISGVLVIDKPQGPTSHDMVAVARRALGERRIGHCGTLDPMATGVLALAVGQATRLVQFLSSEKKHYDATIRFGRTTDSFDATGEVTSESSDRPSREAVEAALAGFRGALLQTPPTFSAKKIGGHRAYDLARRDDRPAPALEPVAVATYLLELTAFDGEVASLSMVVSAGFYVRSLAHDLGRVLGMGAVLDSLRRTRSGNFGLSDATPAEVLVTAGRDAMISRLIPLERLLTELPSLPLTAEDAGRARRGLDLPAPAGWVPVPALARLLDAEGHLLGLAIRSKRHGFLHPYVVLG